jgi:hypothetical protein
VRWIELPGGLCSRRGSCLSWCGHRYLSDLVRVEAVTPLLGLIDLDLLHVR